MLEITAFLATISSKPPSAFVAERGADMVGIATCRFQSDTMSIDQTTGIVEDVIAHGAPGLGLKLLKTAGDHLFCCGARRVLVERHEDNLLSALICDRAGYRIIDTFYDPDRRASGSRRTVVAALFCEPKT